MLLEERQTKEQKMKVNALDTAYYETQQSIMLTAIQTVAHTECCRAL